MNFLVTFATTDGHTAHIAERIAETMRQAGHAVTLSDIRSLPRGLHPEKFDGVVVGGSVHPGYQRRLKRFIRDNLGALDARPSAFFSVGLALVSQHPEERERAFETPLRFVQSLGWSPDVVKPFAGALLFSRYGFLRRPIMRRIVKEQMGEVDDTQDRVYTDWQDVDAFALSFARRVEGVPAAGPELRPEA